MDRDENQRQQRIRQLYEQEGWSCAGIARELGLSRQRVFQIKDSLGLTRPSGMPQATRLARIAQLMRQGKSQRAIARVLRVSADLVSRDLAQHPQREALITAQREAKPSWQRRAKIPALIRAGKTGPEIAELLGVSSSVIVNDYAAMKLSPDLKAKVHENAKAAISAAVMARNHARAAAGRTE